MGSQHFEVQTPFQNILLVNTPPPLTTIRLMFAKHFFVIYTLMLVIGLI
jgi:hypothetical protein